MGDRTIQTKKMEPTRCCEGPMLKVSKLLDQATRIVLASVFRKQCSILVAVTWMAQWAFLANLWNFSL